MLLHYSTIPLFHHSNCERSELSSYLSSEIVVFSGKKFFGIFVDAYLSKLQRNLSGRSTFFVWSFEFWCLESVSDFVFPAFPG